MLSAYRVLDLTTERGLLCGQILGDLGADVIKVEPPGGSPARQLGPFYQDQPHPDRSLLWWAYNRNKRGITLDLTSPAGKEIFLRLVQSAHFLIESDNPGAMTQLGLGYDTLAALNPGLIYISISAFGQDGPKASYADSDLVILTASGPTILSGDSDRAPLRLSVPQAYLHACAEAATAAMLANHERHRSGHGQYIDVSAQQAIALATQAYILSGPYKDVEIQRMAGGIKVGPITIRLLWPAKDGYVAITYLFGTAFGHFTKRLMDWIHEEGLCSDEIQAMDWVRFGGELFAGGEAIAKFEQLKLIVEDFTTTKTKAELLQGALERTLLIAPISKLDEVVDSPQLNARGYWQEIAHPELGQTFKYPGPFVKFSETPITYRRRPPLVGEHNREIFVNELGMSEQQMVTLQSAGTI